MAAAVQELSNGSKEAVKFWFTSDLHLDHANIVKYCNRPFRNVEEMNRAIINNWNEVVRPEDIVYVLGDFALTKKEKIAWFRSELQGYVILVKGNHDRSTKQMLEAGFDEVWPHGVMDFDDRQVYVRHIPNYNWSPYTKGDVHLCGHVHEKWKRKGDMINVGVDQWGFTPRTLEELLSAEDQRL